ncbi:sorting nexin-4-like [Lingula anatina]|uniref:Sorting nexin-4-like n=1 Tax=Lingula anatina TaxID=7574 RepID=A0A1S3IHE9_LINAN|nr:sorting nexin-4-like [Lingula anatina]XP_013422219.1 sorting nexin-4-like [Lingula anatina]|eukprot:XP_013397548.1 sorting nexin-4-like [Lingula anatina]
MADEGENEVYSQDIMVDSKEEGEALPKSEPKKNLLKWMEITLSEPERRVGISMKMQETYMVYLIETKITDETVEGYGDPPTSIWRRYSEFEMLRNYLEVMYPFVVVPPLPEKKATFTWQKSTTDKFDPEFIERRRVGLENFVLRVASHPLMSQDELFRDFLKQEEGWREKLIETGYQAKGDSKLRTLSASYRIKKPDSRFEEMKSYSNELQSHIGNVLKIRAKLCDRLYAYHKVNANYGRVFSEWSALEKEMADGLQSAGHFVDVYASSIDALLEDEEQFADQLKEYYAFCDAVRNVCRRQELAQLNMEKAEENLTYKRNQRDQLAEGKTSGLSLTGLKSKLFGGDTAEQREEKLKVLDEQIKEAEAQVKTQTEEAREFVKDALQDLERFQRQKVKDLKESFTNYALFQIERCKKGIEVWQKTRECFEKM